MPRMGFLTRLHSATNSQRGQCYHCGVPSILFQEFGWQGGSPVDYFHHLLRMAMEVEEKEAKDESGKKGPAPSLLEVDGGNVEDFDDILTTLGSGKWNVLCYIAIAYWNILLPYHTIAGAFISPSVDHTCRVPPSALTPTLTDALNTTTTTIMDISLHHDTSCNYLSEDPSTGKLKQLPCTEWDFDNTTFTSTVTSEFGLVCEYQYLRAGHQSIYMGGVLVGAFFSGFLADRFGRWTLIAVSTSLYAVLALGSAWLSSIYLLLGARFLLGTMHPATLMTSYILVTEITEIKRRLFVSTMLLNAWSVGTILCGLWAYLERNWRWLQTYMSLFCPIFLPALLFLKESPRWLVVNGHHQEALSVLQLAARMNGTTLPPNDKMLLVMKEVEHKSKPEAKVQSNIPMRMINQMTILFKTRKMITITFSTCIGFFSVAMIYFGLILGANIYDVNPFVYVIISGLVELLSIINIFLVDIIGRKKSVMGFFVICAVTLLTQSLIPNNLKWLSITLVMVGRFAANTVYNVLFLYSSELFPTEIRSQGMNACMISSRISAFIAPFFMSALEQTYPWAVSVVFGVAAALAAVSFVPLWETMNTCLPDTVAQLETMDVQRKPKQDCSEQNYGNVIEITSF